MTNPVQGHRRVSLSSEKLGALLSQFSGFPENNLKKDFRQCFGWEEPPERGTATNPRREVEKEKSQPQIQDRGDCICGHLGLDPWREPPRNHTEHTLEFGSSFDSGPVLQQHLITIKRPTPNPMLLGWEPQRISGKGWEDDSPRMSQIPRIHMREGKNWFLEVVSWSPSTCYNIYIPMHITYTPPPTPPTYKTINKCKRSKEMNFGGGINIESIAWAFSIIQGCPKAMNSSALPSALLGLPRQCQAGKANSTWTGKCGPQLQVSSWASEPKESAVAHPEHLLHFLFPLIDPVVIGGWESLAHWASEDCCQTRWECAGGKGV